MYLGGYGLSFLSFHITIYLMLFDCRIEGEQTEIGHKSGQITNSASSYGSVLLSDRG